MRPLARIVFRSEDDHGKAGLITGLCFQGQGIFEGDDVWQIEECLGELILKKIGKSCIKREPTDNNNVCWCHDISSIVESMGKEMILTDHEMEDHINKSKEEGCQTQD